MDNMEPVRATPTASRRTRYQWEKFTDGNWWKFRDVPDEVLTDDLQQNNRVRTSARQWAARHGYQTEVRTQRKGKELYIRFTKAEALDMNAATTDGVQFPAGSPAHEAYRAELRTELAKFAAGEHPYPYPTY